MRVLSKVQPLGFHWKTQDPFLFCAHHLDKYPEGNALLGPKASLEGRVMGQDFDLKNDWKMYHGPTVPGFPEHPHRGFETVTIVLEGYVDHHDSGGAYGRYGQGDVQWMTAGSGMQHAEMFPLLNSEGPNTLHLFQVWLNLPKRSKFVDPHYKMLWAEDIPKVMVESDGKKSEVTIIAGAFKGKRAPAPNPDSWAADPEHHVDILLIDMEDGARLEVSGRSETVRRTLYVYEGTAVRVNGQELAGNHQAALPAQTIEIVNTGKPAKMLLLSAEPINELVAQYGPFVMNTRAEIEQAYADYRRTRFGGWPWDRSDPVRPRTEGRIAKYANGEEHRPGE